MRYLKGTQLHPDDRAHVLAAYVYRPTYENAARHPLPPNYRGPIGTDEEWLAVSEFAVKANGRLDMRVNHCTTAFPKQSA